MNKIQETIVGGIWRPGILNDSGGVAYGAGTNLFLPDMRKGNVDAFLKNLSHKINPDVLSENIVRARLVHGNTVAVAKEAVKEIQATDGLITNNPTLALTLTTADCGAVAFFDPQHNAVGLFHVGWRGVANNILKVGIEKMHQEYATKPEQLIASIGPTISSQRYEVGTVVYEAFSNIFKQKDMDTFFTLHSENKYNLNMSCAIETQLLEAGIIKNNIEISHFNTTDNAELFPSARRAGGVAHVHPAFFMISLKNNAILSR